MYSNSLDIVDLHDIIIEVIHLGRVEFVSLLLSHGFPIKPSFTREAIVFKVKRVLECFLEAG